MSENCPEIQESTTSAKLGFTLIEMIITMAVMAIMISAGVAAYNTFNRRQTLSQAVETLRNDMRMAQNKAISGEKPAGFCVGPLQLNGYRIVFDAAPTPDQYRIEAVCSNLASTAVKTISLPNSVSISAGPEIYFRVGTQGVEMAASDASRTVTLAGFGLARSITVTRQGQITLN